MLVQQATYKNIRNLPLYSKTNYMILKIHFINNYYNLHDKLRETLYMRKIHVRLYIFSNFLNDGKQTTTFYAEMTLTTDVWAIEAGKSLPTFTSVERP